MARAVLWGAALLAFVIAAVIAINFVGFGKAFPVVFIPVVAVFVYTLCYPLWRRREADEAMEKDNADPTIPASEQPDYRAPWQGGPL